MKIQLFLVGKTGKQYIKEGMNEYIKRINKYNPFEMIVIPELKKSGKMDVETVKFKESELILKKIAADSYLILLDENGNNYTSVKFAHFLQNKFLSVSATISFVIGGAYGFSEEVYNRANEKISLSKMTFSHQLVRLIFLEQLYRGFTIIRGEPYHHE